MSESFVLENNEDDFAGDLPTRNFFVFLFFEFMNLFDQIGTGFFFLFFFDDWRNTTRIFGCGFVIDTWRTI